jgi:hypothetical protein
MLALPIVESPLRDDVYLQQSNCTETNVKGAIRSGVVCLIAACAMHNQLEVVHADRDYDAIAGISSLRAKNIAPRIQRS